MKALCNRLKRVWYLVWHSDAFDRFDRWDECAANIETILRHPAYPYVEHAVRKTAVDPSWHPTKDHEKKRKETIEWAGIYCREAKVELPSAWQLNFMVEWIIGQRKGSL
ncbi:MAG: hypothetical protein A4E20_01405 [Nitrospira sp. SG-bin2]|uniref:hypothetical protein n=1 Tax=Nitrospira cf. moscoviensis SBR1015 TaxID=96242 RepID=UPI000A0D7EF9|nr:hypothetical protein [Nitrospira cf. moscoviensis SBR1015]OQW34861.1 MAG: hypothetical protein A4E20_01405 [Nitrospira sp. SG-bin2]